MTLLSRTNYSVAACSVISDIGVGVYTLLSVIGQRTPQILGIIACVSYCLCGIVGIGLLFLTDRRHSVYVRVLCAISFIVPVVVEGAALGSALLGPGRSNVGRLFCGESGTCNWAGDRALLTAFVLWITAAVLQIMYFVMFLGGHSMILNGRDSVGSEQQRETPAPSVRSNMVVTEQQAFRYPLNRNVTDEEPFTLEAALMSKSPIPAKTPPGHQPALSSASQTSDPTFVPSHLNDNSHHRSWASTLPTAVSIASPRSSRFSAQTTPSELRGLSPSKPDWMQWGVASSNPSHTAKKESQSSHASQSSTSSKNSRASRKAPKTLFHLPSSIANRPELPSIPASLLRRSHSKSSSQPVFPNTADPAQLDTLSEETHSELTLGDRRQSLSTIKLSPERRRSGIFGLRSRVPDSPRSSWILRSPRGSPTRRSFRNSPPKPSDPVFHSDGAFGEWDTSNLDSESYYQGISDARDISGPLGLGVPPSSSRKGSAQSETSLWQGRSVRVGSDGSVVARLTPADHTGRRVSTVGPQTLDEGIRVDPI